MNESKSIVPPFGSYNSFVLADGTAIPQGSTMAFSSRAQY